MLLNWSGVVMAIRSFSFQCDSRQLQNSKYPQNIHVKSDSHPPKYGWLMTINSAYDRQQIMDKRRCTTDTLQTIQGPFLHANELLIWKVFKPDNSTENSVFLIKRVSLCKEYRGWNLCVLRLKNVTYLCYSQFLLSHISRHIDHLHPVPQWFRDGVSDVSSANEQHLQGQRVHTLLRKHHSMILQQSVFHTIADVSRSTSTRFCLFVV